MQKILTGFIVGVSILFSSSISFAAPPDDTFVVGLPTDTIGLEPAQISSRHTANILKHIFGTLFFISETGTLDPNLAESYSVSDDAKEYTFGWEITKPLIDSSTKSEWLLIIFFINLI